MPTRGGRAGAPLQELRQTLAAVESGQAGVNAGIDRAGRSALHIACSLATQLSGRDIREAVMFLLEMGANPQVTDSSGERAVDVAVRMAAEPSGRAALAALEEYAASTRKAQLGAESLPEPCAELGPHEETALCAWSAVVPTVLYYLTPSRELRCRDVHSSLSFSVLTLDPSCPPGIVVIPHSDALQGTSSIDVLVTATGLVLGVDHSKVEPTVTVHQSVIVFDVNTEAAEPLCTFRWVSESIGGPRVASVAERVARGRKLKPTYLASMKEELASLERDSNAFQEKLARQPPPDPSYGFARNLLLYPYGSDGPPPPAEEEPSGEEEAEVSVGDSWCGALVYASTDATGDFVVALRIPPPRLRRYPDPACAFAAAVEDAAEDLPEYDKLLAAGQAKDDLPKRAARQRLPEALHFSCLGAATLEGNCLAIAAGAGVHAVYNAARHEFTLNAKEGISADTAVIARADSDEENGDDAPPLTAALPVAAPGCVAVGASEEGAAATLCGGEVRTLSISTGITEQFFGASGATASGCVHPKQPGLAVVVKDGMLLWLDMPSRSAGVAGPVRLTPHEVSRKREDGDLGDGAAVDAPSGLQRVCFNSDGKLLLRHNILYGTCCVYDWAHTAANIRALQHRISAQHPLVDADGCQVMHCVGRESLRTHLARQVSVGQPTQAVFDQLIGCCRAIASSGVSANFRDADGRTPVHHAALLAGCSDPNKARAAAATLKWLLRRGGSLYCCDKSQCRPLDEVVLPRYTAGTGGSNRPVQTTALSVVMRYREAQERGRRQRRDVPIIAELGEHCDQVCGSAANDGVLYFASAARGEIVALNVEREFSAPLHSYPGVLRMCVIPYSDTLHEGRRDRDYIILSDGTLLSVRWSAGLSELPEVEVRRTALRADVQPGVPCGVCLTATAVHRRPELGSEEYTVGIVGAVVTFVPSYASDGRSVKEVRVVRLSSVLLPHDTSAVVMIDFLQRAINAAWEEEARSGGSSTSLRVPLEALPVQMVSANSPTNPEGGLVVVFERPTTGEETVGYHYQSSTLTPIHADRLNEEGGTAGVAIAPADTGRPVTAARFSRSVDVIPLASRRRSRVSILRSSLQIPGGDDLAEMTAGCFHPQERGQLAILREGDLCVYDVETESAAVVAHLALSDLELRRKAADKDGTDDDRISGPQGLSFSANGVYLLRYNAFYHSFCVYAWADVLRARRRCGPHDWLVYLNTSIDVAAAERRPPRRAALKGNLKRVTTKRLTLREKVEELEVMCRAVEGAMVPANFRDADGKTALHILCDIAHLLPPAEVTTRVHWLLEKGAALQSVDYDLTRPADLMAIGGTGRAPFMAALRAFEDRHVLTATVEPPLGTHWECDLQISQIAPSATSPSVVYALCPQREAPTAGEPRVFDGRVAGAGCGWRVVAVDFERGRMDDLVSGPAVASNRRVGLLGMPYQPTLHGEEPIDFLLVSTGALLMVRRTPSGNAVAEFDTDVRFFAGSASTCVSGPRHAGLCCGADVMWVPASALPPAAAKDEDGEHEEEAWDDMLGALCIAVEVGGQVKLRTLRLPRIEHSEANVGRYLSVLLRLASPVEQTLPIDPAGEGASTDVRISGAWRVSGGEFVVSLAGREPRLLSHRGTPKAVQHTVSDAAASTAGSAVGCYSGAVFAAFPRHRAAGCAVYSVVPNAPLQSSFVEVWRTADSASDSCDPPACCFHPAAQELLMIIDNELVCYHTDSGRAVAVRLVEMSETESTLRSREGDGDGRGLVGQQVLCLTAGGRYLCRLNLLYGRLSVYDWEAMDCHVRAWAISDPQARNAVHLGGLCQRDPQATPVPRAVSCLQPERRGNAHRKEATRALCGRLSSALGDVVSQRACMLRLLGNIMQGAIGPNFRDADGRTALHLAMLTCAHSPREELQASVIFLMKMGASLYTCDSGGSTPLDLLPRPSMGPSPSGPPAKGALEAVLEYHVRHFEQEALGPPGKDTSKAPAVLASLPAPYPSHEIPLTVTQVVPSTVAGGLVYCVAENEGSGPVLYACHLAGGVEPQVMYESPQLGMALRAFCLPYHPAVNSPREGSSVLHDLIAISDGTLLDVEIHTPPDLLPRVHSVSSANTRLSFFSSNSTPFGYAAALFWDDEGTPSRAEGFFGRVTGTAGETRMEVRRLVVEEQALQPGEEELSTRLGAVSSALKEGTVCVDAYLATAHTVVSMSALPGRFVITMAGQQLLQWCKGDDDVRPTRGQVRSRGNPVGSVSAVCDGKAHLATFSKVVEVTSFDVNGERAEHLLDDSADDMAGGAFNPVHPHLLFFTKGAELCVLDLRQRTIRVVGDIQKGERETGDDIQESTLNLLSFSADGGYLLRHAVGESIVAVYRWSELVAHLERINAESEVINNAVYLPMRVASIDVQDLYKEVVAMLRRQRGVASESVLPNHPGESQSQET
eukprot:Hpha_TRINITY_DN16506_c1_g7::TRINITY_DN16506_c1_g7_i1::g.132599::m.132599